MKYSTPRDFELGNTIRATHGLSTLRFHTSHTPIPRRAFLMQVVSAWNKRVRGKKWTEQKTAKNKRGSISQDQ